MIILVGCQQVVHAEGASKVVPASLPRHRTCAILILHQELARCSTFNGRPRWARAGLGSMAISCAVCSLQRAVCSVCVCVCVHDRHRCLHEYALTSCDRMASTSLHLGPPQALPHLQTSDAGERQRADDHLRQFLFLSMCCMLRCGSSCPDPRFPPGARATPKRRRVTARMVNSAGTDRVLAIPDVRGHRCCCR